MALTLSISLPGSADPDTEALRSAGIDAYRDGRFAEAETRLRAAIARRPGDAAAHDNLGLVLAALGRPAEAESAFRQAIALAPSLAGANNNLAALYRAQQRLDDALAASARALALDPSVAAFHLNHGEILRALLRPREAAEAYARALRLKPDYADAYFALGNLWYETGNRDGARFALDACLKLDPADRHGARALLALVEPASGDVLQFPAAYVRNLFDGYAPRFEKHLVEQLDYRAPQRLRAAIDACDPGRVFDDAIDLGCGTGLAGAAVRPIVRRLVGVDLSPAMIEHARARGVFDALGVGGLDSALAGRERAFDLILAADVFIYVGALDEVLPAIFRALRPDGLAGFTIESDPAGPPCRLRSSRRFAHNPGDLAALAARAGFALARREDFVLRREAGAPIDGTLFVLRRPAG